MFLLKPSAVLMLVCAIALTPYPVLAAAGQESMLHKAYYMEHEQKDFEAAKRLYDQFLAQSPGGVAKAAAMAGSARCRDALAARNFACLMPEETLVYVEVSRPGEIIGKLAAMVGLTGRPIRETLDARPSADSAIPFHVPSEFVVSPALLDALAGFGGAAAAITDIDFEGGRPPKGVLIVHHGDVALLKGALETAFQFAPTAEKIKGLPTFGTPPFEGMRCCGVLTESLLIVGTSRGLVQGAVERLTGERPDSLATQDGLSALIDENDDATFLACANLRGLFEGAVKQMPPQDQQGFAVFDAIADLESLRWATLSFGIDEGVLGVKCAVRLAEDHRNLVYNMMRLPPMSRNALKHVPPDAAAFLGIGLNPAWAQTTLQAAQAGRTDKTAVSALDIGREFFGNIQEICAFVVPGNMDTIKGDENGMPLPNIGVLFAVNDVAKSRALWDQLLSVIPGTMSGEGPNGGKAMKIGGTPVTSYAIPEFGKIYLAELDGAVAIGLTRSAIKAAIRTQTKGKSVLDDSVMRPIIDRLPADGTIMAVAHVGRLADLASGCHEMEVKMIAPQVSRLCRNTVAWFGLAQASNRISFEIAVTGLPNANEALQQFGPLMNGMAGLAMQPPRDARLESTTAPTRASH